MNYADRAEHLHKENVPNLRFPKFSGEWGKTSIGECFSKVENGLTYDTNNTSGVPVTRIETISDKSINYDRVGYANIDDKISKYEMQYGDVLFSHINSLKHIGKTAFYDAAQPLYHGMNLLLLRAKKSQDSKFLYYTLNTHRFLHRCQVLANQAVNQASINTKELKGIKISVPQMQEQQKIAGLISLLDDRIATQIKIIEKLESLIRGIVETHYSQSECVNQVRISELGEPFSTMNMSKEDLSEEGNECILYGELFTTYGCVIKEVKSRTHISTDKATTSQSNDLLFPASTTVDAMSLIAPSAICKEGVILGGDLFGVHVNKNYNNGYLSYLINYIYKSKLARYAQGSTIIHLHYSDIKNATLLLPTIEEQNYLAHIMRGVEEKINIEKDMLSKLYNQKAYLLSNLFI